MRSVCVFGASSSRVNRVYLEAAHEAGRLLAGAGLTLVFGGGDKGLMGAVARGAKEAGGRVIGVIPERLHQPGVAYAGCDELIVTADMHTRKAKMEALSDAFLALPGGFGTFEELFEVITLNQLGYLCAPVVLLNTQGYYDALLCQIKTVVAEAFADAGSLALCPAAQTPAEAVALLQKPPDAPYDTKMREYLGKAR